MGAVAAVAHGSHFVRARSAGGGGGAGGSSQGAALLFLSVPSVPICLRPCLWWSTACAVWLKELDPHSLLAVFPCAQVENPLQLGPVENCSFAEDESASGSYVAEVQLLHTRTLTGTHFSEPSPP